MTTENSLNYFEFRPQSDLSSGLKRDEFRWRGEGGCSVVNSPQLGFLVHSLSGRDAGEYYLVVGIMKSNFVLVANGSNRPLQNPKKKNLRHLKILQSALPELKAKIAGGTADNEDVARAIREMVCSENPGGEREGTLT
jgi:ribosomal protein L14E/L6E/L27E